MEGRAARARGRMSQKIAAQRNGAAPAGAAAHPGRDREQTGLLSTFQFTGGLLPGNFLLAALFDFGFLGVIVGGVLFGLLIKSWDQRIEILRTADRAVEIMPYACVIGWLFLLLRGSLVGVLGPIVVAFFMTLYLVKFARIGAVEIRGVETVQRARARSMRRHRDPGMT